MKVGKIHFIQIGTSSRLIVQDILVDSIPYQSQMRSVEEEITKQYTLEDWRSSTIEIHRIPRDVLELTLKDVLRFAFKLPAIDLNPIELIFGCIFEHNGWRVQRMPLSRSRPVNHYMGAGIEQVTGIREELYGPGVPDFFLWNRNGEHRFVEIKASEETLNDNQRSWVDTYDCHFQIAKLVPINDDFTEEEILQMNKMVRRDH